MNSAASPSASGRLRWVGRLLSALAILFLLFDSIIHLLVIPPVVDALNRLGYPVSLAFALGVLEIGSLVLYSIPSTGILGAILLTGYLGGAVSAQLRIGAPMFSTALFPVYVGGLVWGGLWLREPRLRDLLPGRQERGARDVGHPAG